MLRVLKRWTGAAMVAATALLTGCSTGGHTDTAQRFTDLETKYGARLGVYATDSLAHRESERFAFDSTFKPLACAALLHEHPLATGYFDQTIHYTHDDLVPYSPTTETRLDTGMTVAELCEAAITRSDNTAGNQILKLLGGPPALTAFLRTIGDDTTRSDRWETDLNTSIPGDDRDTTTPRAIAADYRKLVVENTLGAPERDLLESWLIANTTGAQRIRAGLPNTWTVGDKTGTGDYASANDIAVAWTDRGEPVVIAVLTAKPDQRAQPDNALLADAARIVADALR